MTLYRKLCRFVYVGSETNPEPQLWYGEHTDGNGKRKPVLMEVDITEWHEHLLSLNGLEVNVSNLERMYPYETPLV